MGKSYTYSDLRNGILAILGTVSNVGQLHNRIRYSDSWQTLLDQFSVPSEDPTLPATVLGWMLTRTAIEPVDTDSHYGAVYHLHHMQLQGIMGFSDLDDSDGAFQDLIDRVVEALESDTDLYSTSNVVEGTRRPTVNTIELRMFGRLLGHYVDMDFAVPTVDTH